LSRRILNLEVKAPEGLPMTITVTRGTLNTNSRHSGSQAIEVPAKFAGSCYGECLSCVTCANTVDLQVIADDAGVVNLNINISPANPYGGKTVTVTGFYNGDTGGINLPKTTLNFQPLPLPPNPESITLAVNSSATLQVPNSMQLTATVKDSIGAGVGRVPVQFAAVRQTAAEIAGDSVGADAPKIDTHLEDVQRPLTDTGSAPKKGRDTEGSQAQQQSLQTGYVRTTPAPTTGWWSLVNTWVVLTDENGVATLTTGSFSSGNFQFVASALKPNGDTVTSTPVSVSWRKRPNSSSSYGHYRWAWLARKSGLLNRWGVW
jgi:hypothetical protein